MLFFCRTCRNQLPQFFMHDATHDIVSLEEIVPEMVFLNPVFLGLDTKWYFWDETWAYLNGPYDTEADAQFNLKVYTDWLNGKLI